MFAFEAFQGSADAFRKNTEAVTQNHFQQAAVSGHNGTALLDTSEDWIFHSLGDKGIEVETATLDSVLELVGKCDLLKIDCEGAEVDILANCTQKRCAIF